MGPLNIPDGSRLLLDSMCIIYAVEEVCPYVDLLTEVFQGIDDGRYGCVLSPLVTTEVLARPLRNGDALLARRFRTMLGNLRDARMVPFDLSVAERAADIRARYGLRTPDAIHVATALHAGCTHILTNDRAWQRVTECAVVVLQDVVAAP